VKSRGLCLSSFDIRYSTFDIRDFSSFSSMGFGLLTGIGNPMKTSSLLAATVSFFLLAATSAQAQSAPAPAAAPGAWRVWSSDIHDPDDKDTQCALCVNIVAARNGWFSGKVVASPRAGLKAVVSDLKQGESVIPATAIAVRYAVPWSGKLAMGSEAKGSDILLEAPPEEMPADRLPIWLTVKVPEGAKPGAYAGQLTVSAPGNTDIKVSVKLEVANWTAPSPGERRTWLELIESPDTLAAEYNVPLWSDKHWDLIARSMSLLGEAGSRILYIPLVSHTNAGNEESMVRWIRKGDNQCDFDFTVMDKYLDLAIKNMGKPKLVVFNVYDRYLTRPGAGGRDFQTQTGLRVAAAGPIVTQLDPATGKTRQSILPDTPPREGLTVSLAWVRDPVTIDDYLKNRIEDMKKNLDDFKELEKGKAAVDGADARWMVFSSSMGPFRMKSLVYVMVREKKGVQINCIAQADKFDHVRADFDKVAQGLKVGAKDITLEQPPGWEKAQFEYRDSGVGTGIVAMAWGPGDAAGEAGPVAGAWKSLFARIREHMQKRDLEKQMLLGMVSDFWPTKDQVAFLDEVSGHLPWANASHYYRKEKLQGIAPITYHAFYFGVRFGYKGSLFGWKRPGNEITATFDRAAFLDGWPMARWRHMGEYAVTGNVQGVGRLGADTWNVLRDKKGARSARVYARYPETDWGYLNIRSSVLAPGPQGALATARFEILREGIQDCEARILLEQAVTDPALKGKLGADLAKRCEEALAERTASLWKSIASAGSTGADDSWRGRASTEGQTWFLASNWQDRARKLYALAAEVAEKVR
jgi:hypothetical protein